PCTRNAQEAMSCRQLKWHRDESCTQAVNRAVPFALAQGMHLTSYWSNGRCSTRVDLQLKWSQHSGFVKLYSSSTVFDQNGTGISYNLFACQPSVTREKRTGQSEAALGRIEWRKSVPIKSWLLVLVSHFTNAPSSFPMTKKMLAICL